MPMLLETSLGTVRVHDFRRPSRPGTQAVSYRARLLFRGKYRDGKPYYTSLTCVKVDNKLYLTVYNFLQL